MKEILILIAVISSIFFIPFIFSLIVAWYIPCMPDEERKPKNIKDLFTIVGYNGYCSTNFCDYQPIFEVLRIPIIGFVGTVLLILVVIIYCIHELILKIPGVAKINGIIKEKVSAIYNKIINYDLSDLRKE